MSLHHTFVMLEVSWLCVLKGQKSIPQMVPWRFWSAGTSAQMS